MTRTVQEIIATTAVVVPAFNAAPYLAGVIEGITATIPPTQIIVVNDGSTDGTGETARRAGVNVVEHVTNQGKGLALRSGAQKATEMGMEYIITMDADGQHDPAEIPKFIEHARKTGVDIVLGNRMENRKNMPAIRVFANRATSAFVTFRTGRRIPDSQNGYRLLKSWVFQKVRLQTKKYDTESEILIKAAAAGARIDSVPIETIYGTETSSVNPFIDTLRFFRMVFRSLFW